MKILYLTAIELDVDGGPKTHIVEMLDAWVRQGHRIYFLSPYFDKKNQNLPVESITFPFFGYSFPRRMVSYICLFTILLKLIPRYRPDVIYVRQMEYNPFVRIACRMFRVPYCIEINGLMSEDLATAGSGAFPVAFHEMIERYEFNSACGIFATSSRLKEKICRRYESVQKKTFYIPNGVNRSLFRPMNKQDCRLHRNLEADKKYIGFIGTINHLHDPEKIIAAFAEVAKNMPDVRLIIVGDGPKKRICRKLACDLEIENKVIFTGAVPYRDIPFYINCFDIGVVTASKNRLEREGLVAFKLQELLSCGCPTIAYYQSPEDFKKYSDFVKMVHVEDSTGLSTAMKDLLADRERCLSMSEQSLAYIRENVSWEKSARLTGDIMHTIIASQKRLL